MKIVLLRPPFTGIYGSLVGPALTIPIFNKPPMNLLYLAASLLQETEYEVEVIDAAVMHYSIKEATNVVMERNPDIVGIMAYLPLLPEARLMAKEIKKASPLAQVIVGGPMVEYYPKEILSWEEVDSIVLRDGESVLPELVKVIAANGDLSQVDGIGYKHENQTFLTTQCRQCDNLDEIPFPDRTLLPYKKYHTFLCEAPYSTVLLTSRGCPFTCRFCPNSKRRAHKVHFRSAGNIVDEIEEILELDIRKIFIYDDSFCFSRRRVMEFCDEVLKRKLKKFSFSIKARVKPLDNEMLKRLKEAGCTQLGFGLESGSNRMLNHMGKGTTVEDNMKAITMCKGNGLISMGYFVLGFPGETMEEALQTIDFAIKSPLDFAQFYACNTFPGSDIYYDGIKKGIFGDYWADYSRDPLSHKDFPNWDDPIPAEIKTKLVKQAHNKFYLSPRKVFRRLRIFNAPYRRKRLFQIGFDFLTGRVFKYN